MDKDFEAFIYCDKGIYKSIKNLDETASVTQFPLHILRRRMLHFPALLFTFCRDYGII